MKSGRPGVMFGGIVLLASLTFAVACQDSGAKLEEHVTRAAEYLDQEQFSEAILEYKSALQIDPNRGDVHYGLARSYLGLKKPKNAYWELQETVRLDPGNLDAKIQYGQFLLFGKEGDLEQAVAQADEVLLEDASRFAALILKGRALQALRRNDEAEQAYAQAVETAPEESGPLLMLASFHRMQGNAEKAEPLFRKLTEIDPSVGSYAALAGFLAADRERDVEAEAAYLEALERSGDTEQIAAISVLANFYFSRERYEDAERLLRSGIDQEEDDLELIYALARLYNVRGDIEKADAMILEATRSTPTDPKPYLVLSSYRGRQGDLEGALEAAESALESFPDHAPARLRKAELLVDLGFRAGDTERVAQGRAIVTAVLSKDDANPEGLLVRSKIDLAEGKLDDAVASLRRALDGRADWAQAHFLLGSALFLQRDLNGARAEVARALEIDADMVEAQRVLARIHSDLGEHQLCVETGEKVLAREAADAATRILVAQCHVNLRSIQQARSQLERIPEGDRDAEAYYALGRIEILQGSPADARVHLERALEFDPNRYEILRALLDLDIREKRVAESEKRVQAAVAAKPDDSRLVQLHGEVALYLGRNEQAEKSFGRAIELNPNDLTAYEKLARYLMVTGRPEEVLKTYESALERNPSSGSLNLVLGSLYELQGRREDAMGRYEDAVRLDPSLAVAKNNLAYLLAETGGDLERALNLAQEAKEQLPDNPNTADTLGWVLYKKNVPTAAIGYLKEAERNLAPENPQIGVIRHHLALAYEAAGDQDQARLTLARALRDLDALSSGEDAQPEPSWVGDLRAMLKRLGGPPASNQAASNEG